MKMMKGKTDCQMKMTVICPLVALPTPMTAMSLVSFSALTAVVFRSFRAQACGNLYCVKVFDDPQHAQHPQRAEACSEPNSPEACGRQEFRVLGLGH